MLVVLLVLQVREDFELSENALELLHFVLLEDNAGFHDLITAKEDHSLSRIG